MIPEPQTKFVSIDSEKLAAAISNIAFGKAQHIVAFINAIDLDESVIKIINEKHFCGLKNIVRDGNRWTMTFVDEF